MSDIKILGKMINDWHAEWDASPELQFQFVRWNDYAFGRQLRRIWEASGDFQRAYGNDFRKFSTAVKREAGIDYRERQAAAARQVDDEFQRKNKKFAKRISEMFGVFPRRRLPPSKPPG